MMLPASLKCLAVSLLVSMTATSSGLAQIVWSFTAPADSTATASPTSGLPTTLTGGVISVFQSGGTPVINSTSASSGYEGASGVHNFSVGSAPAGAFSVSGSAYFEFTLAPTAGLGINATSLTLGSRSTSTGPTTIKLFSSADGFVSAIGTVTATATIAAPWTLLDFGSFNITTTTDTALTFRIYGGDGFGTGSGNWRIDDVTLHASAVPEPATYALFGGIGALGLAACARLRSRRTNCPRFSDTAD